MPVILGPGCNAARVGRTEQWSLAGLSAVLASSSVRAAEPAVGRGSGFILKKKGLESIPCLESPFDIIGNHNLSYPIIGSKPICWYTYHSPWSSPSDWHCLANVKRIKPRCLILSPCIPTHMIIPFETTLRIIHFIIQLLLGSKNISNIRWLHCINSHHRKTCRLINRLITWRLKILRDIFYFHSNNLILPEKLISFLHIIIRTEWTLFSIKRNTILLVIKPSSRQISITPIPTNSAKSFLEPSASRINTQIKIFYNLGRMVTISLFILFKFFKHSFFGKYFPSTGSIFTTIIPPAHFNCQTILSKKNNQFFKPYRLIFFLSYHPTSKHIQSIPRMDRWGS